MAELSVDPQTQIMLNLAPRDLLHYCQTNRQFNEICRSPYFLNQYFGRYGLRPEQVPGTTSTEKLLFMAWFNWDEVPGTTLPEKGQFIRETIEIANQTDLNTMVRETYPGLQTLFGRGQYYVSPGFRTALLRAVQTGSPEFAQQILNQLVSRIRLLPRALRFQLRQPGLSPLLSYMDSFRDPFLAAIGRPRQQEIWAVLLQHYDPATDNILFVGVLPDAVLTGNFHMVQALSTIVPPREEWFSLAVDNGQPEIARYFYNELIQRGIDPTRNQEVIADEYENYIRMNNLASVQTLAQFVRPGAEQIRLAEHFGRDEILNFLQTV